MDNGYMCPICRYFTSILFKANTLGSHTDSEKMIHSPGVAMPLQTGMPDDTSRYFPVFKPVNLPDLQNGNDRLDSHPRLNEYSPTYRAVSCSF
jgi:hypothetical protein